MCIVLCEVGNLFSFLLPLFTGESIPHFSLLTIVPQEICCAKLLLYSATCTTSWVSHNWVKCVYSPPLWAYRYSHCSQVCHLPEKHWSVTGPFLLMFPDFVSVSWPLLFSSGPYPCSLHSYSGVWVRVTNHTSVPRTEEFPQCRT